MTESWEQMISRHKRERADLLRDEIAPMFETAMGNTAAMIEVVEILEALSGLSADTINGSDRGHNVSMVRHVAFWISKRHGHTLSEIGRAFKRDHSTGKYGCERIDELINERKKDE